MTRQDLLAPLLEPTGALRDLMIAYFNEDWRDDCESWTDVVTAYVSDAKATDVEKAVAEFDRLIASDATDEDVDWLLREGLGSGFSPANNGMGAREALLAIRDELRRHLPADSADRAR